MRGAERSWSEPANNQSIALASSLPRDNFGRFTQPAFEIGDQRCAQLLPRPSPSFDTLAMDRTLNVEQPVDAPNCLDGQRRNHACRSSLRLAPGIGFDIGQDEEGPTGCTQHGASVIGPGLRSASYSLLYPP